MVVFRDMELARRRAQCKQKTPESSIRESRAEQVLVARTHLGGDADDLLRAIIDQSGSQPPAD
jgi:hypothetical protein